jgi:hypothetical protein
MPRDDRISITDRHAETIDILHSTADVLNSLLRIARQMDRCDVDDLAETLTKQAASARHTEGSRPYVTVEARTGPGRPSKAGTSARVLMPGPRSAGNAAYFASAIRGE